jgi:uroporphyrinogen III methyltransferase / synthase
VAEPSSLSGKRVVTTRPLNQSGALIELLRTSGATAIPLPLVRIEPPLDFAFFDAALRDLKSFDWMIFGSQNAVAAVAGRLRVLGVDIRSIPRSLKIAAVGKMTAAAAVEAGFEVSRVGKSTAAHLVAEIAGELHGKRVFLPRSDHAAAALFAQVQEAGGQPTEVCAYRTVASRSLDPASIAAAADADAILFFSPSAAHVYLELVHAEVLCPVEESTAIGAIGPVTQAALREAGMRCDLVAPEPSDQHIVAALAAYFEKRRASSAGANSR